MLLAIGTRMSAYTILTLIALTSLVTSYARYRFNRKPCCPSTFTCIVSCLRHHSLGSPEPEIVDGAPLATPPAPLVAAAVGAGGDVTAEGNLGTLHGSSVEYPRAATCRAASEVEGGTVKAEAEAASAAKSSVGTGSASSWANRATCSMLTSRRRQFRNVVAAVDGLPLPPCTSAASARAT